MDAARRLLEVKNLRTSFFTEEGEVKAVDDVSFHVDCGEVVAIVGESGCGKSITQLSIIQLVQSPPGRILAGEVLFKGKDLLALGPTSKEMRSVRGAGISMIFQEPMTSLNPVLTIGRQLSEIIVVHRRCNKAEARRKAISALEAVGIPEAAERMNSYPFELSGGMRQRVMIAAAVAAGSEVLIADEPTTALDVTTQAQVMELLIDIVRSQGKSLVLVTHNLGLVSRYAQRVYVMYAGKVVESGTVEQMLTAPSHPYTIGLLNSIPKLEGDADADLEPIQGAPPRLNDLPAYCTFLPRCPRARDVCREQPFPALRQVGPAGHAAACHLSQVGMAPAGGEGGVLGH